MSRAPLRISFAGGGTDIDAFAYYWGGCVVSVTIARYVRARMEPGVECYTCYPKKQNDVVFLQKIAAHFGRSALEIDVDAPPKSGLGASGALAVSVIGCLNSLKEDEPLAPSQIAELAHKIEVEDMGITGGKQDQYAAVFGGLNYMEFGSERVNVTRIEVKPETLLSLENGLLLVFTKPRPTHSGTIMSQEDALIKARNEVTIEALKRQKELANDVRRVLRKGDLQTFGEILHEAWEVKKKQSPTTSDSEIDEIYDAARKAGAVGGKLSGAGGGGYMFFFAPKHAGEVGEAMRTMGLTPERVSFDFSGLRVWRT
jgi:D-glycero-alpha-D-manno-heptose-7-phosphate kinase